MLQMPFPSFLPQANWQPTSVDQLPVWDSSVRVGLDCETRDPQLRKLGIGVRRDGKLIGYSFAFEDGLGYYIPFGHEGEGNLDKETCLRYLRDQAKHFTGTLVGANLQYDLDYLAEEGVVFKKVKMFRDVQIAEPLINEHRLKYGLDALAKIYNMPGKDETLLRQAAAVYQINSKSELYRLPPRFVGAYAEQDAHLPMQILRKQERILEDEDLWGIYDLESKLIPINVKMRRRGVLVSQDRLAQITNHIKGMEQKLCDEMNRLSTVSIAPSDLKKASALAPLILSLGYEPPKTEKTKKYSITKDYLKTLDHPIAVLLNQARAFSTMGGFCKGIPRYLTDKSRVHCTFNQLKSDKGDGSGDTKGAVSGRYSATNPALQQQPIRHATLGYLWRGIYLPDEGCDWTTSDFSAQEPRLSVHYAELTGCTGAEAAGDRFRNNADEDAYEFMVKATGFDRNSIKAIILGISYGMGEVKLCKSLGYPTVIEKDWKNRNREVAGFEGKAVMSKFNSTVPYIAELKKRAVDKAEKTGVIRTLLGRAIHFPTDGVGNFDWTYKALNRLIQGGSADQMKQAMIDADEAGLKIQIQIHDELDMSTRNREESNLLAEVMTHAVKLKVPTKVDLEIGPSFGEINEKGLKMCKEFYK